jgi:pimeloyl-ACP methyl ester carboxylesterase
MLRPRAAGSVLPAPAEHGLARPRRGHLELRREVFPLSHGTFHALAGGDPASPPLLYLHGFPDHPPTAASFLTELARRGYRVLAPWQRGYAPSPTLGPIGPGAAVRDALELLDRWSPDQPAAVVGHDWGAVHTYLACLVARGRVARAVTLALPHPLTFLRQLFSAAQLRRSWYLALLQLPGARRLIAARRFALVDLLWRRWSPRFSLPLSARAELHACLAASGSAPIRYYRPTIATIASLRRLGQPISTPLLQLHGADDGCVLPPKLDDERRYSGPRTLAIVPGVGHFLHVEAPDAIAELVGAWLAQPPLSSGIASAAGPSQAQTSHSRQSPERPSG